MKKFRLALMAFAVISFAGLSSCGNGMSDEEAQKAADTLVNAMDNAAVDQAIDEADQTVVETEEVTDTTAAPAEEATEETK